MPRCRHETDLEVGSDLGRTAGGACCDWFAGGTLGTGGASCTGSCSQSAMFERRAAMLDGDARVQPTGEITILGMFEIRRELVSIDKGK